MTSFPLALTGLLLSLGAAILGAEIVLWAVKTIASRVLSRLSSNRLLRLYSR